MMRGIWLVTKKSLTANKVRTSLAIITIMLGVTVTVSLQTAIESIKIDIKKSYDVRSLGADIIVEPGDEFIPDSVMREIINDYNIKEVYPQYSIWSLYKTEKRDYWVLLMGVKIKEETEIGSLELIKGKFPKEEEILLTSDFAEKINVAINDTIDIVNEEGQFTLKVSGQIDSSGLGREANGTVCLMPLENMKELLGITKITKARLVLKDTTDIAKRNELLQEELGNSVIVSIPAIKDGDSINSLNNLFLGFNIFAGVAFIIGAFLIFNTMNSMIRKASKDIGLLKVMGCVDTDVFLWVILQSLFYGLWGSLLGLISGLGLSRVMVMVIGMSVNTVENTITIPWMKVSQMAVLGVVVAVFSGLVPAIRATRITVMESVSTQRFQSKHQIGNTLMVFIITTMELMIVWLLKESLIYFEYIFFSFVFIWLYLFILLVTKPFVHLAAKLFRGIVPLNSHLISINMTSNVSRTSNTIFALVICIAMSVGLVSTINSFKAAVIDQTKTIYMGDILVSAPFGMKVRDMNSIKNTYGVGKVSPIYKNYVNIYNHSFFVRGIDPYVSEIRYSGDREAVVRRKLMESDTVVISKTLSYKYKILIGDYLTLPTSYGEKKLKVIGYSKNPDQNGWEMFISYKNFESYYPKNYCEEYIISIDENLSPPEIISFLEKKVSNNETEFYDLSKWIREGEEDINEMFSLFFVLIAILFIVAALVLMNSMIMNIRELKFELSLLKSFGMCQKQLVSFMLCIGLLYGIFSILCGSVFGVFINFSLIKFAQMIMGLELTFRIYYKELLYIGISSLLIVIVSSITPSHYGYRTNLISVLRNDIA